MTGGPGTTLFAMVIPWVFFAIFISQRWPYYRLERDGVETRGVIVATLPAHHGAVDTRFEAGGASYVVRSHPGRGNPDPSELKVGDSISVTYLRDDPAIARGGRRPAGSVRELMVLLVLATVASALLGVLGRRFTATR
jgi:hypothetical protein